MSQEELSEAARVSRPHLSDIERGAANPSLEIVLRLQHALGLSSIELLTSGLPRWGSEVMAAQAIDSS